MAVGLAGDDDGEDRMAAWMRHVMASLGPIRVIDDSVAFQLHRYLADAVSDSVAIRSLQQAALDALKPIERLWEPPDIETLLAIASYSQNAGVVADRSDQVVVLEGLDQSSEFAELEVRAVQKLRREDAVAYVLLVSVMVVLAVATADAIDGDWAQLRERVWDVAVGLMLWALVELAFGGSGDHG